MGLESLGFYQNKMPREISLVGGERDELRTTWVKGNKPLITSVILGGVCNLKQVKVQPKGRFPRLVLDPKMEYLHISPGPRIKLGTTTSKSKKAIHNHILIHMHS